MNGKSFIGNFTPRFWYFSFTRETTVWWWRWWPGTYKHVTCFAGIPELGCWVIIDPMFDRTEIAVIPDAEAERLLNFLARPGSEVIRMPVLHTRSRLPRWGYWCTALAAHLVGLRSCAFSPDTLLRQCLRHGGVIVGSEEDASAHCGTSAEPP